MAEADAAAPLPTDYIRVKRKKTTIFLYYETTDTIHDLRARVNHITKVPTSDVKFYIDINGEVPVDENKTLMDQKVRWDDGTLSLRSLISACRCTLTHQYLSLRVSVLLSALALRRSAMRIASTWSSKRRALTSGNRWRLESRSRSQRQLNDGVYAVALSFDS